MAMMQPTAFRRPLLTLAAACLAAAAVGGAAPSQPAPLPHLEKRGEAIQLVVDGAPFLVLGGELGNSAGEPDYLRPRWAHLQSLNLNTVLAPVYWELTEPEEGRFDFATVDGLVRDARAHGMRLVLLWFASWKNSMSCYAPAWVKTDTRRFPRARDSEGRSLDILSPVAASNRDADARAFSALMRHLRDTDGDRRTVIMVQVENEIGMIPEVRDRSAAANDLFAKPVPAALLDYLGHQGAATTAALRDLRPAERQQAPGSWEQVFGPGRATEELFTAWHFASYAGAVASAGKAEYALPMFVNAALIRPGYLPGQYPSGGPLPHLFEAWRAAAPSIDFLAPDIYFANFAEWARRYARPGNPLFVPEAQRTGEASVRAFYAIGQLNAIGFSPFAIESIAGSAAAWLGEAYRLLAGLAPTILAHQGRGTMAGLLPEGPEQRQPLELSLGDYVMRVSYEQQVPPALADGAVAATSGAVPALLPAGGLVIATGRDEFLFAGAGLTVTFASARSGDRVGLLNVEEVGFDSGRPTHVRWLNGDETHQGRHVRLEPGRFSVQRVRLYRYRDLT